LLITPFDKSSLKDIEHSINASDLGITPANDGSVIRLVIPALTEETRRELAKEVSEITAKDKAHEIQIDYSNWELDKPFAEFIKSVKYEDFKLVNYHPVLNKTVEMLAYKK